MEGILEQILSEMKEIKQLLKNNQNGLYENYGTNQSTNTTMTIKEAAKYLGVSHWMLSMQCKQNKIKHFKAGRKFLFRKDTLDTWLREIQEKSIIAEKEPSSNVIRKIQP